MTHSSTIRHHTAWHALWLLVLASLIAPPLQAQEQWSALGRDGGNQRHSPLTQIDTSNVSTLVPAWRYEMTEPGVPSRPSQSTPLMVNGVLYLSFPYYRVVALEPETGDRIWDYTAPGDWRFGMVTRAHPRRLSSGPRKAS